MNLICTFCRVEFPIPKISSKLFYTCPKCGTVVQYGGYVPIPTPQVVSSASMEGIELVTVKG